MSKYRPISFLLVFSKFIEKTIVEQLTDHLEAIYNLLASRLYEFRRTKSTKLAALIDFMNECIDAVEPGEMVVVVTLIC